MIKKIKAIKILDSRGNPTIEVEIETESGVFKASVPSGASTGKYEAKVIEVLKAIDNVNKIIGPKLIGKNSTNQEEIDKLLIELDGTENKSKLGANAILPVSIVVCRAGAAAKKIPLYKHINEIENCKATLRGVRFASRKIENWQMPRLAFNILNGGAHAKNNLDIQEFMVIPTGESFANNLETGKKIYNNLKIILKREFGVQGIKIGDEGGFAPPISKIEKALDLLIKSINNCLAEIGLDCAASQIYRNLKYRLEGKKLNQKQILNFYKDLLKKCPISFLEDPFDEDDWDSWKKFNLETKKENSEAFLIADDLTATNQERVKKAIKENCIGGIIIKPNQAGTITETLECVKIAKRAGLKIMVSHRSGETMDDFIADLAVGVGADFIKSGAPGPEERMAKYNRLLEIEQELNR